MRALDAALSAVWAMEERALETLLDVLARDNDITPEALEAYRAKSLAAADQAGVRNGVAVLNAIGPLTKRANMFTDISGATSYDILRRDFQAALDDPKVKAILFNVDSPGGEASGTAELAQAVFDARGRKPMAAYVGGVGASAAYWLTSAVDPGNVVVDKTARLGSIGVQLAARVSAPKAGDKSYTFTSSQSPNKNPELGTDASDKQIQSMIDAMAQVFVEDVARNRGVATETVLSNFGKGGTFIGKDAVAAGLADRTGSFEGVLAELAGGRRIGRSKGVSMSDEKTLTAADLDIAVASAVEKAVAASNARIAGITAVAAGYGLDTSAVTAAIASGKTVELFAIENSAAAVTLRAAAIAEAANKPGVPDKARLGALKTDEELAAAAAASSGNDDTVDDEDAIVARIAAA